MIWNIFRNTAKSPSFRELMHVGNKGKMNLCVRACVCLKGRTRATEATYSTGIMNWCLESVATKK